VSYPADVAFSSGALYVADSNNSRILLWSSLPASGSAGAASGTAAIGQADFTSSSANRGSSTGVANGVNWPYGISVIAGSLYVADSGNSRILQFNPLPTGASDTAAAEYGQTDFTGTYPNGVGPNQLGLSYPGSLAVTSQYLIVGDRSNTRYLVYDKTAATSGTQALAVIGQPDFVSTQSNQGGAAAGNTIHGGTGSDVLSCATDSSGRLYISDRDNNRVLVFNQVPTSNNASADYVLGQSSLTGTSASAGATGLSAPYGVTVQGNTLYVADSGNYRVLAYSLPITSNQQAASLVIGQPDFNTTSTGTGANKFLSLPSVVYSDGSSLYVGDYSNRVMVFSPVPTASNPTATAVIGEPDFSTSGVTGAIDAQQFNGPNYVSSGSVMEVGGMSEFGGYLLIPDPNQSRILGFDLSSISTYMSATAVIGQSSFTVNNGGVFSTPDGSAFVNLSGPRQILTDPYSSYVWIADSWTNRVIRVQQSAISKYIH
jgi:hypothetical protein